MSEKLSKSFVRASDGRLGSDISNPFDFKHERHVGAQISEKTGDWTYIGLPPEWADALAAEKPFARDADGRLGKDISLPFNFKHEIHVYGHFSGFPGRWRYENLPPSWAEALESQPSPSEETTPLLEKIRIRRKCFRLNIHPIHHFHRLWAFCTIKFHPQPEEDENISQPFNVKHETHADSKYTSSFHTALILAAEDSWKSVLALSQRQSQPNKKRNRRRTWRCQRQHGTTRPAKPSDAGDENISFPWNFQHIIHVDEDFNGLPPSWADALGISRRKKKCCSHICTG